MAYRDELEGRNRTSLQPCEVSQTSKSAKTLASSDAPSTWFCVIEVSSVQKDVSVGRSVGRTMDRNSSTTVSVDVSTSTAVGGAGMGVGSGSQSHASRVSCAEG